MDDWAGEREQDQRVGMAATAPGAVWLLAVRKCVRVRGWAGELRIEAGRHRMQGGFGDARVAGRVGQLHFHDFVPGERVPDVLAGLDPSLVRISSPSRWRHITVRKRVATEENAFVIDNHVGTMYSTEPATTLPTPPPQSNRPHRRQLARRRRHLPGRGPIKVRCRGCHVVVVNEGSAECRSVLPSVR